MMTSLIIFYSSAAQRELVDSGRVSRKMTSDSDDGQWAEGLVSAAQMVTRLSMARLKDLHLILVDLNILFRFRFFQVAAATHSLGKPVTVREVNKKYCKEGGN